MAMEGNGPLNGTPRPLGKIVLADDPVAADATCARLMGFEPGRIVHIREGSRFLGNLLLNASTRLEKPSMLPQLLSGRPRVPTSSVILRGCLWGSVAPSFRCRERAPEYILAIRPPLQIIRVHVSVPAQTPPPVRNLQGLLTVACTRNLADSVGCLNAVESSRLVVGRDTVFNRGLTAFIQRSLSAAKETICYANTN